MDFTGTSGIRSPFSPRVRQSLAGRRPVSLSSAKKTHSKFMQSQAEQAGDIIYKTPLSTIETYGLPLPVMVTEALTFASGDVSVRLSSCGWCWVVSGRRVLSWPRSQQRISGTASPAPAGSMAARELTLPQTDLAHKADLVMLFYENEAQMPSCIGVSPEGVIRYWPSVGQEGVYVDVTCELAGQECDRLGEYTRSGLVLATTTCTVVLLNPTVIEGRATVTCRTLRPPSGWLGGIGRRVSVLFFGTMPTHADTLSQKLVGVVVLSEGGELECEGGEEQEDEGCIALVAGGPVLQLWRGAELHEHNLRRPLTDAYARTYLAQHGELNTLEIVALDVRASGSRGLLLLVAAVNAARSPEVRYAIAQVSVQEPSSPRVLSLVGVRSAQADEPPPRLLPLGARALLYTDKYIALVSTTSSTEKAEYIDVSSEGDRIIGAELCNGVPLLFSRKHGVLLYSSVDAARTPSACESPMGSPCPSDMYEGNLSLYEIDPHEVSTVTTDACGKLKTAFLFHLRRESGACRALLHELFPPPPAPAPAPAPASPLRRGAGEREGAPDEERDVDSVLDRTVLQIATEMLDDIPAGDPRWKHRGIGGHTNIALGSSAALQVAAQLRDKQRAFSLFLDFLRAAGLWQRLGLVTHECVVKHTEAALGGLAEQLAAAIALRRLQQGPDAQLIDAAVYQVVCGESVEVEEEPEVEAALGAGALSPSDVCFRRASRVGRVLRALCAHRPDAADARAAAVHAARTIHVLTSVLSEVQKVRGQWQWAWQWCAPVAGPRALLPALAELHARAVADAAHNCPDATLRAQVLEAAASLADLILTDAQPLNKATRTQHVFERMRREAIQPFINEGEVERASALAEKFKDFELLIEMCVRGGDLGRLTTYIDKYSHEGMAEATFAWLAQRGGAEAAMLVRTLGAKYPGRLGAWLALVPGRAPLLALHHLATSRPDQAAGVLAALATDETESLNRMTTMASLAKLCLVASEETQPSDVWRKVECQLALSEQHEALPRDIKLHNGLDTEDTGVLTPEQIVQMYVDSDSDSLTEFDFKKALDLTEFIQDMERRDDLRLRVWCACIRHDDWASCPVDSPAEQLHARTFFKLIDLVHVMGGDLELLLPPLEDILTAPELAELVSNPRFHFIIKYAYECVDATTTNDDMIEH
ncbi:hypothetical protein K1T71_011014 [Dendrolimus kikuchii]|uniref:Uncharacterized protein n=1 Tax=Dendrolimus kikuchii TaxID=765133 RepID=A0ACC1CQK6_9NEOP|nr:hypothetical protein K1T71_011014 [Dendrolimus kikuchii]